MCRFTTDAGTPPGKLIFWGIKHGSPALPFPSMFNNRWWNTEEIQRFALGGQVPRPRGYNGRWFVPGVVPGHYCGTPEMFMQGYDPATNPPTPPGPGVIPPCCPKALGGFVGAAAWPTSVVTSWTGPTFRALVQYAVGGSVPVRVGLVRQLTGGYRQGGFVQSTVGFPRSPTGGYRQGGFVQSTVGFPRSPTGGYRQGGFVQSTVGLAPAAGVSGGYRQGGFVQHTVSSTIAPTGGYRVGGQVVALVGPTARTTGGYAVGGAVPVTVEVVLPPTGGYRVGGQVVALVGPQTQPSGGYAVGGQVSDYVGLAAPPPGAACSSAGVFSTSKPYTFLGPAVTGVQQWCKWSVSNGAHTLSFANLGLGSTLVGTVYTGASCSALGAGVTLTVSPHAVAVTNSVVWLEVTSTGGAEFYTFELV
jgi:hypothetical protein